MNHRIGEDKQNVRERHRSQTTQPARSWLHSKRAAARVLGGLTLVFASVGPADMVAGGLVHRRGFPLSTPLPGTFAAGDGVAYLGCSGTLSIFDMKSREELARVYTDGRIEQIELDRAKLYVADGIGGLLVYDISDPSDPMLVGKWNPKGNRRVRGVAVSGGYAYCQVERSVCTIGLSGLKQISAYELPAGMGFSFGGVEATLGAVVFAWSDDSDPLDVRLAILDIRTSPSNPAFAGGWDTPGQASQMCADGAGNRVFVACSSLGTLTEGFDGIQIVDLTDPGAPVGSAALLGDRGVNAVDVFVDGSLAYVTTAPKHDPRVTAGSERGGAIRGSIVVYDVAGSPVWRTVVGLRRGSAPLGPICISQGVALCSGGNNSGLNLLFVDVSDLHHPVALGSVDLPDFVEGVFVKGTTMYLACGDDGVWIVDVTDPDDCREIGRVDAHPDPGANLSENLWVEGNYVYVADGTHTTIVDVSKEGAPKVLSTFSAGGWQEGVHVRNGYLFVATLKITPSLSHSGVVVYDVHDPSNPTEVARLTTPTGTHDLWVDSKGYVYSAGNELVYAMRWQPPDKLSMVGQIPMGSNSQAWDVAENGGFLYVACRMVDSAVKGFGGLQIYSLSLPSSPQLVSSVRSGDNRGSESVWVDGDVAVITGDKSIVIGIGDPHAPAIIGHSQMASTALNVMAREGVFYFAGFAGGAPILQLEWQTPNR
ncbi:MAG: hypothetical protein HYX75_03720 [Acidobacteria bacterium]|nr:hypothetical protein [Acidobacteriota bacterium]